MTSDAREREGSGTAHNNSYLSLPAVFILQFIKLDCRQRQIAKRYAQALFGQLNLMDKEIERQIEEKSSSAIEFRKSIDEIVFGRLRDFFMTKGQEISRDSSLRDLLGKHFTLKDWNELGNIDLRIPELRRHKAFNYVTAIYGLTAVTIWVIILVTNLEALIIVSSLPLGVVASVLFILTLSPVLGFMAIFKKRILPADTIDKLVDGIISENWSDLLTDDKKWFKEILEQELTSGKRASA